MKRGEDRVERGLARAFVVAVLMAVALLAWARPALALDLLDIASPAAQQDLAPYLAGLQTGQRNIAIARPDVPGEGGPQMTLAARAPGPQFNWLSAGFSNSSKEARSVVLSVPQQAFGGSGFYPARLAGPRIFGVTVAGQGSVEALPVPGENAYLLTIPAGGTAAIALEANQPVIPAVMWQRDAYGGHKDFLSFFRGALLGVSVLLAIALFALYGFRARALFPVAGGFALCCVAFMLFEAGHLLALVNQMAIPGLSFQVLRGVIEGLMAAFLLLLLATLSDLHRVARIAGNLLLGAGGLAFVLPVYAFADPLTATAAARAVFAATAASGIVLLLFLWARDEVRPETALASWGAVLIWTIFAGVAALAGPPGPTTSTVLMAGLGAVLVVLGFALAHHAFSQGFLSRHFFREAGRHALALAGARTFVWDWQPEDGDLYLSPEISRALAQPPGIFDDDAAEAFLDIMHPADRSAYLATIEEAEADGRTPIERRFRLAHADGSYRWFELRARSITGRGLRAARCIGTLVDVTGAKLAEERLLEDAVYDVVTGLPNRALFADRLARALSAERAAEAMNLYVLLADLDRFKMVNDAIGHDAGDALLAIVGRRLAEAFAAADCVARLPGDQFGLLLRAESGDQEAAALAQLVADTVAEPIDFEGQEYFLTASVGLARAGGGDATAAAVLKQAAIALYEARRKGVEAVAVFEPSMVDGRAELVVLESELRRAIARNEIEVHYQPIARLADMQLAGFEALVRWRHPKLGLLAPESFLGLAEETGMIRDIGRVVLNEAGRQLGIWQRAYRPAEPAFVAVNISSAQLIEPGLVEDVKAIINREGLARGSLKVEVTETLVMHYPERAAQILERFRDLGVGLSCDDFGTGYSSLSSLRKLPFDTIKVDRGFIAPEAEDQRAAVILRAILDLGHALGLAVVAEGLENQEQVDRMGALGCDYGQGFFIGKPLTARQVKDALAGMPYAHASGRTAITWLWERSMKDPPPVPSVRRVMASDVAGPARRQRPAQPAPASGPAPPSRARRQPAPAAQAPDESPTPASAPVASEIESVPSPPMSPAPAPPEPGAEEAEALKGAEREEVMAERLEPAMPEVPPPPPPRRRKRQRRSPRLGTP